MQMQVHLKAKYPVNAVNFKRDFYEGSPLIIRPILKGNCLTKNIRGQKLYPSIGLPLSFYRKKISQIFIRPPSGFIYIILSLKRKRELLVGP
jgi:hypothetical protein